MEKQLKLCKQCKTAGKKVNTWCPACEKYRRIVSGAAVKEGNHRFLAEIYKSADTTEENLLQAIMNNDSEIVEILLSGGDLQTSEINRALLHAIIEGNLEIIRMLIDKGAHSNQAIASAIASGNVQTLLFLVKRGYRVTPKRMQQAIEQKDPNMVEALVDRIGLKPTEKDIVAAIESDQWNIVKILYERMSGELSPELESVISSRLQVQRAHFPNGGSTEEKILTTFEDQLAAAYQDIRAYPKDEVFVMARAMGIVCEGKDFDYICKQVAYKVIYTNNTRIPNASNNNKCMRYTKKIAPAKMNEIRARIYKQFSKFKNSVPKMTKQDLHALLKAYDDICFNGDILRLMGEMNYTLQFKMEGEPTFTTEGICTHSSCDYTITILTKKFSAVRGRTNVAGHMCNDQLECLMRVLEHEMCHLIIFVFCTDIYIADQHGPLFINTISELFGHRDHRHYIF